MDQTDEDRFRTAQHLTEEPLYVEYENDRSSSWKVGGITFVVGLAGALLLYAAWPAKAHQAPTGWAYPLECCSNRDCVALPKGAVKETPAGFVVTILPGQHDFVKDAPVQFVIPYGEEKLSPDGLDHICLTPQLRWLCFFASSRGF